MKSHFRLEKYFNDETMSLDTKVSSCIPDSLHMTWTVDDHFPGSQWTRSDGWNNKSNSNPCTFYGVSCISAFFQTFYVLNLTNNNLFGSLPSSFSQVSWGSIDLSNNQIEGQLVGPLRSLRYLDVSGNSLEGEIPLWITQATGDYSSFSRQNLWRLVAKTSFFQQIFYKVFSDDLLIQNRTGVLRFGK